LAGRVRTLALPDEFLPHGKASDILKSNGLDSAGVAKAVYEAVKGNVRTEA
jgi:deoxyxylulose-5-phosphate synthase